MPPYNTQVPPPALFWAFPHNQFLLFNKEALTTGEFSQQVSIPPSPVGSADARIRITIDFNLAPGAFEIDIMEDDVDNLGAAHYAQIPVAGVVNAINAGSVTQATINLAPFQGQFLSLFVKTQPANPNITCTALATRR